MVPVWQAFGWTDLDDSQLADQRVEWDAMRPLGARVDGEWIGTAADFPFEMTLPGGTTLPAAGVTMVGVSPPHRRRGVLTALMRHQLDDVVRRGEPLAILSASESGIYGRFGYGPATSNVAVELATDRSSFIATPDAPGQCHLLAKDAALPLARAAYEACRLSRPGALTRDDWKWEGIRRDPTWERDGASARFWLVHTDGDGTPDGYATYRIRESWDGLPHSTAMVHDLHGVTSEVEAELWRFLLDLDLVERVTCSARPADDPLRWWLADSRRLLTRGVADWLWVRVLDVSVAFSARRYGSEDVLVLDVADPFRPAGGGRFRLDGGPDGACCSPTTDAADLALDVADLGALYLGGVAASTLAAARRVTEHTPGALARADALFASRPLPFSDTHF